MSLAFDPQVQVYRSACHDKDCKEWSMCRESLKDAGQQFEALFIQIMLKQMRDTVPVEGLIGDDFGSDMYRDILDQQIALHTAREENLGFVSSLYQSFARETILESAGQDADKGTLVAEKPS